MTPDAPTPEASPELVVRVAGPADAALVAGLLHDFNVEFESPTPSAAEFAARFERLLQRHDVLVLLAHRGQPAVGFVLATTRPSPYFDGGVTVVDELYVRPSQRDRGIGGALLSGVVEWASARGVGEIHIGVDEVDVDARRFYEHHDFSNLEVTELSTSRMLMFVRELVQPTGL